MQSFFPFLFLTLFLSLTPSLSLAFPTPPNDGFVTDTVSIISEQEESEIEAVLESYRAQTSNEIAVLIVGSLQGESIADTAIAIGRDWGIGGRENNNGLLMLIAYEDREVFLATGYGLEGAIPDIVAKGIIEEDILPSFRDGAYVQGIQAGIEAIIKHIGGEYTAQRYVAFGAGKESRVPLLFGGIVLLFFVSFFLAIFKEFIMHTAPTPSFWEGGLIGGFFGVIFGLFFGWILSIPLFIILGCVIDFVASFLYKRFLWIRQWVHGHRRRRRGRGRWWFFGGGGGRGGFGGFGGGSFGGGGAGGRW